MRYFYNTETDRIFTESQLKREYNELKHDIDESSGAKTFEEYLQNCLSKNGCLEEITCAEYLRLDNIITQNNLY